MAETPATSYDEIPYGGGAFAATHPGRMATAAFLAGLRPPAAESCRILELGCGVGGNLLPLAVSLPGSHLVGIDASARQIGQAQTAAAALELENVTFLACDIRSISGEFGTFDYIICHGVFSWVPSDVQDHILAICQRNLSANGVAYISYNTYPGWHIRGMLRDVLAFRARAFTEPRERLRQGQAFLNFLDGAFPDPDTLFAKLMLKEAESLKPSPDWYLYHEHLDGVNRPLYFHEFVGRAHAHGLQYLGEAQPWPPESPPLSPAAVQRLAEFSTDPIEREQYEDFLRCRMFRRTLLYRAEAGQVCQPAPEAVMGLRAAGVVRPEAAQPDVASNAAEKFRAPKGASITTNHPLIKAALVVLAEVYPRSIPFNALWEGVRSRLSWPAGAADQEHQGRQFLAEAMLHCYSTELAELHVLEDAFVTEPGERPRASRIARHQASSGAERVTNLRHRDVELHAFDRLLVPLLDGTRDRTALVEHLAGLVNEGVFDVEHGGNPVKDPVVLRDVLMAWVEEALRRLAFQSLMAG